jgi:hypothetical protein
MSFPNPGPKFPPHVDSMNLKQMIAFAVGAFSYLFALSMFFYFPSLEAWTAPVLGAGVLPYSAWVYSLLVLLVALPCSLSPLALASRAGSYIRPVLAASCLSLGGLFLLAAGGHPLLNGRVALVGLLTGQFLALGRRCADSVPFNWMVYLGFILANLSYPDPAILACANLAAGGYLLFAGASLLLGRWEVPVNKRGFSVMVG